MRSQSTILLAELWLCMVFIKARIANSPALKLRVAVPWVSFEEKFSRFSNRVLTPIEWDMLQYFLGTFTAPVLLKANKTQILMERSRWLYHSLGTICMPLALLRVAQLTQRDSCRKGTHQTISQHVRRLILVAGVSMGH